MKKALLALILIVVVGLSGVALGYMLWQSQKPVNQTEIEQQQVVEFLKTTDVKNVLTGTPEITDSYDHKSGGKIVIVEYVTVRGTHPNFTSVLTSLESHRAAIVLHEGGEITSAFCIHGSVQQGKLWDLINQRWIPDNV